MARAIDLPTAELRARFDYKWVVVQGSLRWNVMRLTCGAQMRPARSVLAVHDTDATLAQPLWGLQLKSLFAFTSKHELLLDVNFLAH